MGSKLASTVSLSSHHPISCCKDSCLSTKDSGVHHFFIFTSKGSCVDTLWGVVVLFLQICQITVNRAAPPQLPVDPEQFAIWLSQCYQQLTSNHGPLFCTEHRIALLTSAHYSVKDSSWLWPYWDGNSRGHRGWDWITPVLTPLHNWQVFYLLTHNLYMHL